MRWILYGSVEQHTAESLAAALRVRGHEVASIPHVSRVYPTKPDPDVERRALDRLRAALPADVLVALRPTEIAPADVARLRAEGATVMAWLADDPLLYDAYYRRAVEGYDVTLHTGGEDVLAFYEQRHGVRGYTFPFWTDGDRYRSVYDPAAADADIGFLGNCSGPREFDRYPLLASLPFRVRMYGALGAGAEDWAGLQAGFLPEDEFARGLARFRLGLSLSQPFAERYADRFHWPGLERFREFFFPSRLVFYAACGIPSISLQHPGMPSPLASCRVVTSRRQLIAEARGLLGDPDRLGEISRAARAEFDACLSATTRASMLETLVAGPRVDDRAARASLWRTFGDGAPPEVPAAPGPRLRDALPGPGPSPPSLGAGRVLLVGRDVQPGSDCAGLASEGRAAGLAILVLDLDQSGDAPLGVVGFPAAGGATEISAPALSAAAERAQPDAIVFTEGCVPSEGAAALARERGIPTVLVAADDPAHRGAGRFDRVVTSSPDAAASWRADGREDVRLVPAGAAVWEAEELPNPEGVALHGRDPDATWKIRCALEQSTSLQRPPAAVELFVDPPATRDVLAAQGRGAVAVVPAGAVPEGISEDEVVTFAHPAEGVGAAAWYSLRPDEAHEFRARGRARAATTRLAGSWASIIGGGRPARAPRPHALIIGNYGRANVGDDLILATTGSRIEADFDVATYAPVGALLEHGWPACSMRDPSALEERIRSSSSVVLGGGGLLHDHTFRSRGKVEDVFGDSNLMLARSGWIAAQAQAHGVPLALHAIGIGPLETDPARRIVRFIAQRASFVSVRDGGSLRALRASGYEGPALLGADPVFLAGETPEQPAGAWLRERGVGDFIAVALRTWDGAPGDFTARVAAALDRVTAEGLRVVFVALQGGEGDRSDAVISARVAAAMRSGDGLSVETPDAPLIHGILGRARAVLAMRLHASVLANLSLVPSVGLAYDPKVRAHYEELGRPRLALALDVEPERAARALLELAGAGEEARADLATAVAPLRERAERAMHALQEFVWSARRSVPRPGRDAVLAELRAELESGSVRPAGPPAPV